MNLSPVIISALFQFCIGLGWYDGYSYHIFSNKYLKKHKPRNYYHSSTFPIWKRQYFWRKRRTAEDGSRLISNNILLLHQLSASKRFLQYSPYFHKFFGKVRSKPRTHKPKSKHKFNDFSSLRNNFNSNAFVRRNFVRPPYYPFYFKSPSMYLSHYNNLHVSNVDRMHSGTSEIKNRLVDVALKTAENPLSSKLFKSNRVVGNSLLPALESEKIDIIPKQNDDISIMKVDLFRKVLTESNIDPIVVAQQESIGQNSGSYVQSNKQLQDEIRGTFIESDNSHSRDRDLEKFLTSDIALDKEIQFEPNIMESKGTLSENSFGKINHYPLAQENLNAIDKAKTLGLNNFGTFDVTHILPIHGNTYSKSNNTRSPETFVDERTDSDFSTSTSDQHALGKLNTFRLNDQPLEVQNPSSRDSQLVEGIFTETDGFSDNANLGFGIEGEDGYFDLDQTEGSFNNDQSGCDGITTRKCTSDSDCSCYGSFFCVHGMCAMVTATNYDNPDDTADKQFWL